MGARTFLDSNVIVYAFDRSEPVKRKKALALLEQGEDFVVSTQVLAEFYWVVTRKLERPLDPGRAQAVVGRLAELPVVLVDVPMILAAVARSRRSRLALWDAMIVQAAVEGGCVRLLSEDLQAGRTHARVVVENPFA